MRSLNSANGSLMIWDNYTFWEFQFKVSSNGCHYSQLTFK